MEQLSSRVLRREVEILHVVLIVERVPIGEASRDHRRVVRHDGAAELFEAEYLGGAPNLTFTISTGRGARNSFGRRVHVAAA